jgi:hypothetical protein
MTDGEDSDDQDGSADPKPTRPDPGETVMEYRKGGKAGPPCGPRRDRPTEREEPEPSRPDPGESEDSG